MKANLHPALERQYFNPLSRPRVRKFAQLSRVRWHGLDLTIKEMANIHVEIRLERILWKGRCCIGRPWNFVRKKPANLRLRDRPTGYQCGSEDRAVILVRIPSVMRVYHDGFTS